MNDHPVNLSVRFALELVALIVFATWGWQHEGAWQYVLAIGLPVLAAVVWSVFRVPGDPKAAPVAVSGPVRLALEAVFFGAAVAALFDLQYPRLAWVVLIIVVVHYAVSYDRVERLVGRGRREA